MFSGCTLLPDSEETELGSSNQEASYQVADSYLCFQLALLHSVSHLFLLNQSPSSSFCAVFDSISSNIDEVLSVNPSLKCVCLWRL